MEVEWTYRSKHQCKCERKADLDVNPAPETNPEKSNTETQDNIP